MVNLCEPVLDFGTISDIERGVSVGVYEDSGPIDPLVAQGLDRFERVACAPFAGGRPASGRGGDLEALDQVVGHHTQSLPGAVGPYCPKTRPTVMSSRRVTGKTDLRCSSMVEAQHSAQAHGAFDAA